MAVGSRRAGKPICRTDRFSAGAGPRTRRRSAAGRRRWQLQRGEGAPLCRRWSPSPSIAAENRQRLSASFALSERRSRGLQTLMMLLLFLCRCHRPPRRGRALGALLEERQQHRRRHRRLHHLSACCSAARRPCSLLLVVECVVCDWLSLTLSGDAHPEEESHQNTRARERDEYRREM